jgi:lysophospholipase L1-like esterase
VTPPAPILWRASTRRDLLRLAGLALSAGAAPAAEAAAAGIPATILVSHRLTAGPFTDGPPADTTAITLDNLAGDPAWIRLVHFNDQPRPCRIDRAAIALTAAAYDGRTPVDGAGKPDAGAWRPVRYDAQGASTMPGAGRPGAGPLFSLTMPPHEGPAAQPGLAFSDWMALPPRPRIDGGSGTLLIGRVYASEPQRGIRVGVPDPAIGRSFAASLAAGDAAQAPWLASQARPGPTAGYAVQYISRAPTLTMIAIGDSITASAATHGGISGYAFRASVMLSQPNRRMEFFNEAVAGRRSAAFLANGRRQIALIRPQCGVLQCWSENDGPTRAAAEAALSESLTLAAWAKRSGCILALCTAAPVYSRCPEAEAHRRWSNDLVRIASHMLQLPLLDLDAIWGTGATPNAYRAAYDAGDHTHPNDGASAVAATALAQLLAPLLPQSSP